MEIVLVGLIFILAGIATELTGFGVATISMALLPFFFPLSLAIPLVAAISTVSTGIVALRTKTKGLWQHMVPLVAGSAVGVPAGIIVLNGVDEAVLRIGLALFLIAYAAVNLLKQKSSLRATTLRSTVVGTVAGFFNGSLNVHGPIVGIYATSAKGFTRNETRDLIATYMFFAGVFTVAAHLASGRVTSETMWYFFFALPFLGIGLAIGAKIFNRLDEKLVRKLILIFVFAAGVMMLV